VSDSVSLRVAQRLANLLRREDAWLIIIVGIDKLPWTAFRWDEGVIRIEATRFFRPKSEESEGDILVDPELLEIFRGYYARRKSEFVIESKKEPDRTVLYDHYRCGRDIGHLIEWLRSKGVVSNTPAPYPAQGVRQSDQRSLRVNRRTGNAPSRRRAGNRGALRRK
jgi:hypothetical protein